MAGMIEMDIGVGERRPYDGYVGVPDCQLDAQALHRHGRGTRKIVGISKCEAIHRRQRSVERDLAPEEGKISTESWIETVEWLTLEQAT